MARSMPDFRSIERWRRAAYTAVAVLGWLIILIVVFWLLGHIVRTILTIGLAAIVAFAVSPIVSLLSRWIPRGFAILIAYVIAFGFIFGLLALLIVTAADQVTNFVHNVPHYAHELTLQEPRLVKLLHPFGVTRSSLHKTQLNIESSLTSLGGSIAKRSVGIVSATAGTIVDAVLVLILSIYFAANGPRIADRLRHEAPTGQRGRMVQLIDIFTNVLGGYIRGQLTLAALIGVLVGAGMWVLGVPYPVLLGVLAFFMEFVPVIGVMVSGAVCVIVALFVGWITALLVLGYFVIIHVIEGDVVGPRIVGRAVGIHPATSLIALVAGTELFGFWGTLFAAPLAGLTQALLVAAWKEYRAGAPEAAMATAKKKVDEAGSGE